MAPPTLEAQLRAAVALSALTRLPLLDGVVRRATAEPEVVDAPVGGVPALVVRPGRGRDAPALVLLNGVTKEGRQHPQVRGLALALARAGFLLCVPDPEGLARGPFARATLDGTAAVIEALASRPDVRGGRVALVGVSIGATLALLAAEETQLAGRISVVAGIAPHVDFPSGLRLATTGDAPPFFSLVLARSLLAALPPGTEADALLARLDAVADDDPAPLAVLAGEHRDASVAAVVRLLLNRDPALFDVLYDDLPDELQLGLDGLSPLAGAERLRCRVELAVGADDPYVPLVQLEALARAATHARVRLTVTSALEHAVPKLSLRRPAELARFDGWMVRSLRAAAEP